MFLVSLLAIIITEEKTLTSLPYVAGVEITKAYSYLCTPVFYKLMSPEKGIDYFARID